MKANQLINDALSDWREVRNAPDLAHDLFNNLDKDEVHRLAVRGLTDEVRAALRRKDSNGVPVYTTVLQPDDAGDLRRVYKQTALFDIADYRVAVGFYAKQAKASERVARALVEDCKRKFGVQLSLQVSA